MDMIDWIPFLAVAVPGILSLIGVIYQARKDRAVVSANATEIISQSAAAIVSMYKEELDNCRLINKENEVKLADLQCQKDNLEIRINKLGQECAIMKRRITRLRNQVKALGETPANGEG